jgi:hypothetical protein
MNNRSFGSYEEELRYGVMRRSYVGPNVWAG